MRMERDEAWQGAPVFSRTLHGRGAVEDAPFGWRRRNLQVVRDSDPGWASARWMIRQRDGLV